jgi:glycosyltransferase involved in cell wall biosynthesis
MLPVVGRMSRAANAGMLAFAIRRIVGARPIVFHCRGEAAALWATAMRTHLPNSGSVVDIRGASPEEILFEHGFDGLAGADAAALRHYETSTRQLRRVLDDAGAILTVSDTLAHWLTAFTDDEKPIEVVPCCVSACVYDEGKRRAARERLGVNDKLVLSYVGTMSGYQHVTDGALKFVADALATNGSVHLLALTNEPSKLQVAARKLGIPDECTTIRRVAQEEVPAYLMASDAGLLIRQPSRMNRVSMPVKVGEYLSCGVPVVLSRMDGWVDDLIRDGGAGIAIDWFRVTNEQRASSVRHVLSMLTTQGKQLRDNAALLCRERFVWPRYTDTVRQAYARSLAQT